MSNLSELLPTGGGQNAVSFVASGTLSSGQTVALKSDGTVEPITTVGGAGSASVFESANSNFISATFDSNSNKVVIAYQDIGNSYYGTAVVGTVSGTSISFGTPVVFNNAYADYTSATFDSNLNKVVIAYRDGGNSNYGTAVVGTVSGTSISFGSAVVYESAFVVYNSATFDSNSNKVVIAYRDDGNSNLGTAVVGTVSGTSISFGSATIFEFARSNYISTTFDSNVNKIVIGYSDGGNSNYGTAVVGTVSGTGISFGTPVVFESAGVRDISATFDSNVNKVVIAHRDEGNSNYATAVVGTVSGTSISFGTPVVFRADLTIRISATFDSNSNKVVIVYYPLEGILGGFAVNATVSGTSISFDTAVKFSNSSVGYTSTTFDSSANKVVIAYGDGGSGFYGTARTFTEKITNITDFIGITAGAISDTATGSVNVYGGINEAQTGLTIGSDYYVQDDGSLSTTESDVKAGQAISATAINMMDLT